MSDERMNEAQIRELVRALTGIQSTFELALGELPQCIQGYDALSHFTPEDLAWLVLLQVDLYHEGEDSEIHTKTELRECERYVRKYAGSNIV